MRAKFLLNQAGLVNLFDNSENFVGTTQYFNHVIHSEPGALGPDYFTSLLPVLTVNAKRQCNPIPDSTLQLRCVYPTQGLSRDFTYLRVFPGPASEFKRRLIVTLHPGVALAPETYMALHPVWRGSALPDKSRSRSAMLGARLRPEWVATATVKIRG